MFEVQGFYPSKGATIYDDATGKVITSGSIIKLTTDDPVHRPLPSWEILNLQ